MAVNEALQELGFASGIKWPNDLLLNGKKICGILCEMQADIENVEWVVVGIGVNVNNTAFPAELQKTATSLLAESGKRQLRAPIAALILQTFEANYQLFLQKGFAPIRKKWLSHAVFLNKEISISSAGELLLGKMSGIDDEGFLLLETENGVRRIASGDLAEGINQ